MQIAKFLCIFVIIMVFALLFFLMIYYFALFLKIFETTAPTNTTGIGEIYWNVLDFVKKILAFVALMLLYAFIISLIVLLIEQKIHEIRFRLYTSR